MPSIDGTVAVDFSSKNVVCYLSVNIALLPQRLFLY